MRSIRSNWNQSGGFLHYAPSLASLLFLLWASAFCWHGPGLEYDEAISVGGAAVLAAGQPVCSATVSLKQNHLCWPLMVAPYVGASKDYVAAPLFLLLGRSVALARFTAALLAALCIWGFGTFLRDQVSPVTGAATALIVSVNPSFLDLTLFDNGNAAMSMAIVGASAACANRLLISGRLPWAFALGLTLGWGVWSRLNFSWLIASVALGSLLAFGTSGLRRLKPFLFIACGFLVGVAPLLVYYARAFSDLRSFIAGSVSYHNFAEFSAFFWYRLRMFAEIFFSDVEHRSIWTARPELPAVVALSGCLALVSVVWCALRVDGNAWIRSFAIASLLLTAILLIAQMPVAEHHLLILLPFVIACVVALLTRIRTRGRAAAVLVTCIAMAYAISAVALQARALVAIHHNRGIGEWSDAISSVTRSLEQDRDGANVKILDWGLKANIFFLSKTLLAPAELFWNSSAQQSGENLTWPEEVSRGGLFLTTAPSGRHFPLATTAFEKALRESHAPYAVQMFQERSGVPYALLYRVGRGNNR